MNLMIGPVTEVQLPTFAHSKYYGSRPDPEIWVFNPTFCLGSFFTLLRPSAGGEKPTIVIGLQRLGRFSRLQCTQRWERWRLRRCRCRPGSWLVCNSGTKIDEWIIALRVNLNSSDWPDRYPVNREGETTARIVILQAARIILGNWATHYLFDESARHFLAELVWESIRDRLVLLFA
jgi:hypothetical protein